MTAREERTRRRAAERKQQKLARKAADHEPGITERSAERSATEHVSSRAAINRANAQHSTGPRTVEGKVKSSRNSFKHGLYSKDLILPGEDETEFDELRARLRSEHQPINTTEDILVNELAENFWRLRRTRALEARAWQPENLDAWTDNGLLALIQRSMAAAERSFFKALTALQKLQKARGFVPSENTAEEDLAPPEDIAPGFVSSEWVEESEIEEGFVWQNGFVSQNPHTTSHRAEPNEPFSVKIRQAPEQAA